MHTTEQPHTSHLIAMMKMSRHHDPFPLTLFSGFRSTSSPKTSMQFVPYAKEKIEHRNHCTTNQPSPSHKSQHSDTLNIHVPQSTSKKERSITQYFIDYPKLPKSNPMHAIMDIDSTDLNLPPIMPSTSLRLTDAQFTVFLDYPQSKSLPDSCSESAARSQPNIITHNSNSNPSSPVSSPSSPCSLSSSSSLSPPSSPSSPTTTQPHASLLMLLNCTQPHSSDPTKPTKRLNDYTGDFKKEFCALLCTHNEARAGWDRFWRKHGCTGKRPCIKAYLAFCDLYQEFIDLRQNPRYRVLGTRTACKCTRTIHSFQPPKSTRYAPY